jgi:hypothetical protein
MAATNRSYITIVSGLPRSGTSLMMQMLAAGGMPVLTDQLRIPDEDNPRGYYEFEPVKTTRQDPSWLTEAPAKAVKMVHLLLYDLPVAYTYRVIFMRRKLDEVLASQRAMLNRQGKQGASLSDDRLGKVFQDQLDKCAEWLRRQTNFSVLYVSYNDLLARPADATAALNQFLDGGLDAGAMTNAVDPSLHRAGRR